MELKYSVEEVLKGLEQCTTTCKDCPFAICDELCSTVLHKACYNVIKKLQADKKRLDDDLSFHFRLNGLLQEQKVELIQDCENAKSEAVKEFAEKLENLSTERLIYEGYGENKLINVVEYEEIHNLVKEMTE